MAASTRSALRVPLACTAAFAVALAVSSGDAAPVRNSDLPINLEAASTDFDYRNNSLVFKRVRITQGQMQVDAEEARATGLNFDNSQWDLRGNVQILVPDGRLESSQATVTFRDNEILRAVVVGKPASFEQKLRKSQQLAQGRADTIEYDVKASTVKFTGDAWLSDGQYRIQGKTLVYKIDEQRVAANPGGTDPGGVAITINPRAPADAPAPVPNPPQEPKQ